jgi:2-keto-4-pentenoate hydratase/2-oxohepta-3-ene-1,7-dioic acid hydratase in catechol pathway
MKIAQFYDGERLCFGVISEENIQPLDFDGDVTGLMAMIADGVELRYLGPALPLSEVRLAPPVSRPGKIMAIGLNYQDHADEGKADVPQSPLVFSKFSSSVVGPSDDIVWSESITKKVDFEAELAVVIGEKTKNCPESIALGSVFGYTCANDVSARDLQFGDGQWVRGKSLDSFCPIGPWIVTPDELLDPQNLYIQSRLNGKVMQNSNTRNMIFPIAFLVSFMSRHFTLNPGDLILTGTPSGVGAFREPSIYMKDGDEIVIEIEAIGQLRNKCRAAG